MRERFSTRRVARCVKESSIQSALRLTFARLDLQRLLAWHVVGARMRTIRIPEGCSSLGNKRTASSVSRSVHVSVTWSSGASRNAHQIGATLSGMLCVLHDLAGFIAWLAASCCRGQTDFWMRCQTYLRQTESMISCSLLLACVQSPTFGRLMHPLTLPSAPPLQSSLSPTLFSDSSTTHWPHCTRYLKHTRIPIERRIMLIFSVILPTLRG